MLIFRFPRLGSISMENYTSADLTGKSISLEAEFWNSLNE
jgi:hypothetical protein